MCSVLTYKTNNHLLLNCSWRPKYYCHWDHNTQTLYFSSQYWGSPSCTVFSFSMEMKFQPYILRTREKCLYRGMLNTGGHESSPPLLCAQWKMNIWDHRFLTSPCGIRIGNICMQDKDKASKIALTWSIRAFDCSPQKNLVLINQGKHDLSWCWKSTLQKNPTAKMCVATKSSEFT